MTVFGPIARILSKQGSRVDAEQAWRALIERNPDNTSYYYGFLSSKNTDLGDTHPIYYCFQYIN